MPAMTMREIVDRLRRERPDAVALPPSEPCTNPRHTGRTRELLGCTGPDPAATVARQVLDTPTTAPATAAPLAEVWQVWREDEAPYGHYVTEAAARQGMVDFWEEDEPACPDYSWDRQTAGARLELVVGGTHSGVYASRHPVYGTPAPAPAAPADRRDRYAAALATAGGFGWDNLVANYPDDAASYRTEADAAMAVADTEQAALRAELARVKDDRAYWHYEVRNADARIRELDTEVGQWRATFGRDALPGALRPPAFPWATLMDTEDLAEFLAEIEHAVATPGATPAEALAAVETACSTWRLIAEAQHGHNTAPGPDTTEERREPHPTEADLAHALTLLNQLPATAATKEPQP
ncbi:hypothetical protein ACLQ2N_08360 [Streptomyces sp. DT224]|uniref:hypothetical protein n=1 Tax=Streptomyces sp. DT224 TaxID=3393426 RepID=UPI003CF7CB53